MAAVAFIRCIADKSASAEKPSEGSSSGLDIRKLCGAGQAKSLLLPTASPEQRAEVCLRLGELGDDFAAITAVRIA